MRELLQTLIQDYGWIHESLGLLGNVAFFIGSILFLPQFEPYKTVAVWLFISGSFLMLIGAIGRLLVHLWNKNHVS